MIMGKTITKTKTLEEQLLEVAPGDSVLVKYISYSPEHTRRSVSRLNKKGYSYKANANQVECGIIVTRIK